jgi:hypothetical protein
MIRRLTVATVAAAALSLALAGCGNSSTSGSGSGSNSGSGGSGGGSGSAVDWAEKVCKSIEPDVEALGKTPDVDPSDMAKTKDNMVSFLGKFSTALGHMATSLKDSGDPPVANGKEDVAKLISALDSAKKAVDEAKTNLDKASASDPAAFQEAFTKVGEDLSKLGDLEDPTKSLEANKELKDAFDQAPTCKKIDMGGGSSSTPTS